MKGRLFLALWFVSLPVSGSAEFRFRVPEGFEDLSPGTPGASQPGLPDAVRSEIASGRYAAFAMDFREEDGFYENFNAMVTKGSMRVDESQVKEHAEKLPIEYAKVMGAPVTLVEAKLVTIGGVDSIQVVFDVMLAQVRMRQMQYFVPGGNEYAVLTYSATPQSFERYRPVFEAAALATAGAAPAKVVDWWRAIRVGLIAGALSGAVGLVVQLARKNRRAPSRPTMRRMPPRPAPRR